MRVWTTALAAFAIAGPAWAGSYRIVLSEPPAGKLLMGHAGVQAADEVTDVAKVRVLTPGNEVKELGTLRVLVMNLGSKPFEFGPEQVTLTLGDGTLLKPASVETMEKGRVLVERESHYGAAVDFQNRNNLDALAEQTSGGRTGASPGPRGAPSRGPSVSSPLGEDRPTDERLMPGFDTLNAIYQILIPLTVEPQKAWGGYYVFDLPKAAFERKADQPLTILVRTGAEQHRFDATLKWKK
jgi:hypothetical protein